MCKKTRGFPQASFPRFFNSVLGNFWHIFSLISLFRTAPNLLKTTYSNAQGTYLKEKPTRLVLYWCLNYPIYRRQKRNKSHFAQHEHLYINNVNCINYVNFSCTFTWVYTKKTYIRAFSIFPLFPCKSFIFFLHAKTIKYES